jgi:hypothetical protein
MVLGGFRALILQAVHPLVMAGFDDNSFFRGDPRGRLRRTGEWVSTVTYGTTAEAQQAGRRLRRLRASLAPGIEPETGLCYRVDDPELLLWVHCTEVESFLTTYRRSGGRLRRGDGDRYLAEMVASAALVGIPSALVPSTEAEIADYYRRVRPQLRVTGWRCATCSGGLRRRCRPGCSTPRPPARPGRPWSASPRPCCRRGPAGSTGCRDCRRPTSVRPWPRAVRGSLLILPEQIGGNPAYREARGRVAEAAA